MTAELVLIGLLTLTSYRPVPAQTKPNCTSRFSCTTSIDDGITMFGVAASQDLLKSGVLHYGDVILVEGYGYRIVNDTMGKRNTKAVDLMVFTKAQERQVGTRHAKVWKIK